MGEMRKITVEVPEELLASAQAYTGEGVTETVRSALRKLASIQAQQEALKLRGKVKFSLSLEELRRDREWAPPISVRCLHIFEGNPGAMLSGSKLRWSTEN